MKRLRLFFAIEFPEHIKEGLLNLAKRGEKDIWRWTVKENLHITAVFIGYLAEEQIPQVIEAGQKASQNIQSFILKCREISYGSESNKRMVWLNLEKNNALNQLKNKLEKVLLDNGVNFQMENREFKPHITLARLKFGADKPTEQIKKTYVKEFLVEEMILFASNLKKNGAEYVQIQSFP
ncbi:MAG: RNA 2',3'-cyclic phosphodiesterase, partial [bacterium]|nr:RNA 2',3'-cyclic phosphodiesterase [bacterium]